MLIQFTAPAYSAGGSGEGTKPTDVNGHLLIITPVELIVGMSTSLGESDAIKMHLVDLDTETEYDDALWFSSALINALKPQIGTKVLARMGQGNAKPGKSAPWILLDATTDAAAVAKANNYLNRLSAPAPTTPTAPAPASLVDNPEVQALMAKLAAGQ